MFNNTYYHGLIRKHVIVFGTLFNDIHIERKDENNNVVSLQKVPLIYANKDKMLSRLTQDPTLDRKFSLTLPRMSFVLDRIVYAPERKLNSINRIVKKDKTDANSNLTAFVPVPYDFYFTLHLFVNKTEDGTKIIEDILPNFTPDFTLDVVMVEELDYEQKIPTIILGSPTYTDNATSGALDDTRRIVWDIPFVVKGYLLGPIKDKKIIKFISVNFTNGTDTYNTIKLSPGLTVDGKPTTKRSETIDQNTIFADDDFGFIEEKE